MVYFGLSGKIQLVELADLGLFFVNSEVDGLVFALTAVLNTLQAGINGLVIASFFPKDFGHLSFGPDKILIFF